MIQRWPAIAQACGVGIMYPINPRLRVSLRQNTADTRMDKALIVINYVVSALGLTTLEDHFVVGAFSTHVVSKQVGLETMSCGTHVPREKLSPSHRTAASTTIHRGVHVSQDVRGAPGPILVEHHHSTVVHDHRKTLAFRSFTGWRRTTRVGPDGAPCIVTAADKSSRTSQ